MDGLKDWWADRLDTWFFNQAGGFTAQTDLRYTGMQAFLRRMPRTSSGRTAKRRRVAHNG
jgi:hypothetical protein